MHSDSIESFIKLARERGLRVTPQRVQVYKSIVDKRGHMSAEELHQIVKQELPSIALDTVYRTLATLADYGFIKRIHADDVRTRFELHTTPHQHFICIKCKKIIDVEWPEFNRLHLPDSITRLGKSIVPQVELRGICEECASSKKRTPVHESS